MMAVTMAIAIGSPRGSASAHSGTDVEVTSNYRTYLTEVPDDPDLEVDVIDITGTMRLTWNGTGEIIIAGYEDEPYLRLTPGGVERNRRSPATYLNQDRYAAVEVPSEADAAAPPEWEVISSEPTVEWHDHRNHWMSTVEPPAVQADPSSPYVIFDHWEIPISIDGQDGSIGGELVWMPPPSTTTWGLVALTIAIVALGSMFTRLWRVAAALTASIGTIFFTADTVGYYLRSSDTLSNRLFTMLFPVLACWATVRLWIHVRQRSPDPTLAMMSAGLVLAIIGGVDRLDVLTNSQVFTAGPTWLPRVAVVVCLGTGAALIGRFLSFLVPLLVRPVAPTRS